LAIDIWPGHLSQQANFSGTGGHPMSAETQAIQIPEKIMRQIRTDSQNSILRARLCPARSEILQLRCVDFRRETDSQFGAQLWYFEGFGVDETNRKSPIFGALEYSIQFGLHELVDDGVFDSLAQRDRFHSVYRRGHVRTSMWHPAHRWLIVGMLLVTLATAFKFFPILFAE
jgi:hypothetical protein